MLDKAIILLCGGKMADFLFTFSLTWVLSEMLAVPLICVQPGPPHVAVSCKNSLFQAGCRALMKRSMSSII